MRTPKGYNEAKIKNVFIWSCATNAFSGIQLETLAERVNLLRDRDNLQMISAASVNRICRAMGCVGAKKNRRWIERTLDERRHEA